MSTTPTPEPVLPPERTSRRRVGRSVGIAVAAVLGAAVLTGGAVVFGWMIDETHFDRPSAEFDDLAHRIDAVPGLGIEQRERWVEAPTFSDPTSWISVAFAAEDLPAVLDIACASDHPDAVDWSMRVHTDSGTSVSLHSEGRVQDGACPDFGFDTARLIDELDRLAPGVDVQPAVWDNGVFAVGSFEESRGFTHLLPLVAHADDLRDAAGLSSDRSVTVDAAALGVTIAPGEGGRYAALLAVLAEEHGVTDFWASEAHEQADGIAKVQLVAPEREHAAIEALIRASGLPVADVAVRFLEP